MNKIDFRKAWISIVAVITITVGAFAITVNLGDDGDTTVTITIPGLQPVQADRDNQTGPGGVGSSAARPGSDGVTAATGEVGTVIHEDARDETPVGVPAAAASALVHQSDAQGKGAPRPVGGAQNYRCSRKLVQNYSNRAAGSRTLGFVLHYTVSRPGSLWAIYSLFNSPSFGASSHLLLEPTGKCVQIVPFNKKAWTQGAFNSTSESVEIMAMGTESRSWWLNQPIIKKGILASIVRDRLRANGLPLRRVNPRGCGWQRSGWTDHNALECGNNHHDVSPNFPYDVFAKQVRAGAGGVTRVDKVTCRKINWWRANGRPAGLPRERAERRKAALAKRGVVCRKAGPVRA